MAEFQKSLIRFMYVALVVVVVLAAVGMSRSGWRGRPGRSMDGSGPQGVSASGTCVIRTRPELVQVSLGVRQSSSTARAAKAYVKATSGKIIQALRDGGVAANDIQTQNFSMQSVWDSGQGWQVIKWNAEESLRVKIRDIDKVADLIDAAVKAGANRVGSLQYTMDNIAKVRAKGRIKAAAVARGKASQLASALGGKLGRLVSCSEYYPGDSDYGYSSYSRSMMPQANVAMMNSAPPSDGDEPEELTIQPGEMAIYVVVNATYEVE